MFSRMVVFLVEDGVQTRRLQIWKQRLTQMGASIEEKLSKNVTHVFTVDANSLLKKLDCKRLVRSKAKVLLYQWVEDSLTKGEMVSEDLYTISLESGENRETVKEDIASGCTDSELTPKKSRITPFGTDIVSSEDKFHTEDHFGHQLVESSYISRCSSSPEIISGEALYPCGNAVSTGNPVSQVPSYSTAFLGFFSFIFPLDSF
ncbi:unnamed protein product [Cuscuta campestris]|uniref:BRCT domain-containing protein n=1 Tax=Cuscuta campestris TaxID=132261 RepID=A0A484KU71_9ASTE|nr:unnamed protein product [Cuscuta campestris]